VVLLRAQRWPDDQWQQAMKLVSWVRSFPAGTAPVGTLISPRVVVRVHTSTSGPATRHALRALGASGSGGSSALQILALVALLTVAGAFGWRLVRSR
jgi:D-alanyl-D-alanine carboxypeptidase (penicillin-binding protein 5/6)